MAGQYSGAGGFTLDHIVDAEGETLLKTAEQQDAARNAPTAIPTPAVFPIHDERASPMVTRTPEHNVTIARMVTEALLEEARVVEQMHAANLADPGLGPAVARTAELVERAEYIEMAQADEQREIVEAHRRGLTVAQWQDRLEAAIAYAESPEYAQGVWERQGEEYAAADGSDEEDWEDQGDAYTSRFEPAADSSN